MYGGRATANPVTIIVSARNVALILVFMAFSLLPSWSAREWDGWREVVLLPHVGWQCFSGQVAEDNEDARSTRIAHVIVTNVQGGLAGEDPSARFVANARRCPY